VELWLGYIGVWSNVIMLTERKEVLYRALPSVEIYTYISGQIWLWLDLEKANPVPIA